jgi:hypothetical protein
MRWIYMNPGDRCLVTDHEKIRIELYDVCDPPKPASVYKLLLRPMNCHQSDHPPMLPIFPIGLKRFFSLSTGRSGLMLRLLGCRCRRE